MSETPQSNLAEISVADYRDGMADYVSQTQYGGTRFLITRNGRPIMAQVTMEDLALLEAFEKAQQTQFTQEVRATAEERTNQKILEDEVIESCF